MLPLLLLALASGVRVHAERVGGVLAGGYVNDILVRAEDVVQCGQARITWTGTQGPVSLLIGTGGYYIGSTELATLSDLGTSAEWTVTQPEGTDLIFQVTDASGQKGYVQNIRVGPSDDSSCLNGAASVSPSASTSASTSTFASASASTPSSAGGTTTSSSASSAAESATVVAQSESSPLAVSSSSSRASKSRPSTSEPGTTSSAIGSATANSAAPSSISDATVSSATVGSAPGGSTANGSSASASASASASPSASLAGAQSNISSSSSGAGLAQQPLSVGSVVAVAVMAFGLGWL